MDYSSVGRREWIGGRGLASPVGTGPSVRRSSVAPQRWNPWLSIEGNTVSKVTVEWKQAWQVEANKPGAWLEWPWLDFPCVPGLKDQFTGTNRCPLGDTSMVLACPLRWSPSYSECRMMCRWRQSTRSLNLDPNGSYLRNHRARHACAQLAEQQQPQPRSTSNSTNNAANTAPTMTQSGTARLLYRLVPARHCAATTTLYQPRMHTVCPLTVCRSMELC